MRQTLLFPYPRTDTTTMLQQTTNRPSGILSVSQNHKWGMFGGNFGGHTFDDLLQAHGELGTQERNLAIIRATADLPIKKKYR